MATRTRSVPHEEDVVGDVRIDDAWAVVEEFSTIVRESGTEEERSAVDLLMRRLESWGVEHTLHEPELLISLPRGASLSVDGVEYRAKTPSMAGSTAPRDWWRRSSTSTPGTPRPSTTSSPPRMVLAT